MAVLPPEIPDHELLRLIGRGAYGEVWLARNVMGVMRAVKIVRRSSFENQRPFEREFAAVKRYEPVSRVGAGLVNVLHAGRAADDSLFYYVMELADSAEAGLSAEAEPDRYEPCTLRTLIGRMGRMPVAECQEVAASLGGGVAALHRVGLVHRDVKPSNIIFVNGRAKLADIGLVGDISESRSYVGTEGYVPPEGPGQPGADLYGLGRVLYEMATGFEATRFPALPPDWAQQPGNAGAFEFYEIVLRCCEPDAGRRYHTADELLADLALLQSGQSVRQVRLLKGRIAFLKRAALITAGLSLVAGGIAWWQGREAETQRRLVERAERAEAEAKRNLFAGLVQNARNARRSGDHDARFSALALLEQAAALHPGDRGVRDEFISALATPGLRVLSKLEAGSAIGACDALFTHRLSLEENYALILHRLSDGALVRKWKVADAQWLLPVAVGPGGETVWARDDGGRLLSWRNGEALPPQSADGSGDCHWSISRDGTRALAWRTDGTATLIDSSSGTAQRHSWKSTWGFRQNQDAGSLITPDGTRAVISTSEGLSVGIFSLPEGTLLHTLPAPAPVTYGLSISADGETVAAGLSDGRIGVWRPRTSTHCEVIDAGNSYISTLALSPDGRFLLSNTWSSARFLWDLSDGARLCRVRLPFGRAEFSDDSSRLLLDSGMQAAVCEFDGANSCRGLPLPRNALVSQPVESVVHLSLHPSAPFMVCSSAGGTFLIDSADPGILRKWPMRISLPNFSPDGKFLYLPSNLVLQRVPIAEEAGTWRARIPEFLATLPRGSTNATQASAADVAAVRDRQGPWRIFQNARPTSLVDDANAADNASLDAAGALLAIGRRTGSVAIHSTADGSMVKSITAAGDWPTAVFSPDGGTLLVSDARRLRLLRTGTWEELWSNSEGAGGTLSRPARFDPSGKWIHVIPEPGSVTLHDAATGTIAASFHHIRELEWTGCAMSADGSMLWASDGVHQALWRWDLHSLRTFLRARGLDWTDAPLPPPVPEKAPDFDDGVFKFMPGGSR